MNGQRNSVPYLNDWLQNLSSLAKCGGGVCLCSGVVFFLGVSRVCIERRGTGRQIEFEDKRIQRKALLDQARFDYIKTLSSRANKTKDHEKDDTN